MSTFSLGRCSVELDIEPLAGAMAALDRQLAWRLYVTLVARPGLRRDDTAATELPELIRLLSALAAEWPAGTVETARPGQLGFLIVTVIELILLPCLDARAEGAWAAVRAFCAALARELSQSYRFVDPGLNLPKDLLDAWRGT